MKRCFRTLSTQSPRFDVARRWAKGRRTLQTSKKLIISTREANSFYGYTSGRWLWNERKQLARRWLEFDIAGLVRLAAPITGAQSCIDIKKLAEGSFNKVFLLTMNDGNEVIAKLPNPNAGRAHLTTASEVATMDFARNVLKIPVPRVYSWSSSVENPVKAEYILMEKCHGVELQKVWSDLTDRQKAVIINKLVGYEAACASMEFMMYGSLYYATDIPDSRNVVQLKDRFRSMEFAVGPTTDRCYYDQGRDAVDICRGPCKHIVYCALLSIDNLLGATLDQYITSNVQRELDCLKTSIDFPNQQGFFNGPRQYRPSMESKRVILENVLKVADYLKPEDPLLSKPVLWHTDLHSDNIFVDRDDPTTITAIIDWQAVHIAPLFAQVRHPTFLDFEGEIPDGLDPKTIKLPANYESLSQKDQEAAKQLRSAQMLWKLYEMELVCQYNDIRRAMQFDRGLLGRILSYAGNVFSDGELLVEDLLIQLQEQWDQVAEDSSQPCPLNYTDEDKAIHEEQFALWAQGLQLMSDFHHKLGGYRGWDGWVNHEQFKAARANMELFRQDFLRQYASNEAERKAWNDVWPFPAR